MLRKSTFYILLVGRLLAGLILAAGAFTLAKDQSFPVLLLIDLAAFVAVMTFFWTPPFSYSSYVDMIQED